MAWSRGLSKNATGAAVLGAAAVVALGAWFATEHWPRPAAERAGEHWGLLKSYCVDCHNSADFTAGIAFDAMHPEDVPNEAETFEHVVRKLRGGLMPPAGSRFEKVSAGLQRFGMAVKTRVGRGPSGVTR